jgi:hypothetical protein
MKDMNEQIKVLVEDYRKVRVPTVVMAQTGTFALIEALKNGETLSRIETAVQEPSNVEAKIDALTAKVDELSKTVGEIALALAKVTRAPAPASATVQSPAGGRR